MSVSDVFCLPSYREGFGNVVIEAAAMGVPTVGTRIVGLVDSVVDGETGILVPPRDVDALADALSRILSGEALKDEHDEESYVASLRPTTLAEFIDQRREERGPDRRAAHRVQCRAPRRFAFHDCCKP